MEAEYQPDRSLFGKVRRRLVRLWHRRPARVRLARPMVSFTFDDVLMNAAHEGAALLERAGARGTYFVASGLAGKGAFASAQDVQRLAARGHEIACHTRSHLDCGQAPAAQALEDVAQNARQLERWGAAAPVSFAWPFGDLRWSTKRALGERFALCRALHHGLVRDGTDLNQCPAVGIEGPRGARVARRWLLRAEARRAWVILYTHDVAARPSRWGCTPAVLAGLIGHARARGFDIVTVAEGIRRISARN